MNGNAYVVSGIIAFVFLVAKFIEMRFSKTDEEEEAVAQPKPLTAKQTSQLEQFLLLQQVLFTKLLSQSNTTLQERLRLRKEQLPLKIMKTY